MESQSEIRDQAQDPLRRNIDRLANRLAVRAPTNRSSLCRGYAERCGAGFSRWVVKHEVELSWRKLPSIVNIEQIEVGHHHLSVADLAESFKHQVHPYTLARTVNLFTHIASLPT